MVNELRVQYATRAQNRVPNELSGTGPAIRISGVANFGGPIAATTDSGFGFTQNVFQINDNVTLVRGNHAYKAGIDIQTVSDTRTSAPAAVATRSRASPPIKMPPMARTGWDTPASRSISACPISNTTATSLASSFRTIGG